MQGPSCSREAKRAGEPAELKFGGHVESMIVFDNVFVPGRGLHVRGDGGSGHLRDDTGRLAYVHKCMCRWANWTSPLGPLP